MLGQMLGYPVQRVQASIAHLEAATADITRVRLKIDGAPLEFAAGQYAHVRFNGRPARPYSMANRPDDETLEFHIRRVAGGVVSSYVALETRAGDPVQIEGPYGTAFLRLPATEPILLIAGGSGLAPMKSILLSALVQQVRCPIHLYHGVRNAGDVYDARAIANAGAGKIRYTTVLSSPSAHGGGRREGLVHEAVEQDFRSLAGFKVYVAGPPPMVAGAIATALRLGASREDVHADGFYASRHGQRGEPQSRKKIFRDLFRGRG